MRNLGRESHYSWDRPTRRSSRIDLASYKAGKYVLENQAEFGLPWQEPLAWLMGKVGADSTPSKKGPLNAQLRKLMDDSMSVENQKSQIKEFYEHITLKLLHERRCKIAGHNQVDITRE